MENLTAGAKKGCWLKLLENDYPVPLRGSGGILQEKGETKKRLDEGIAD